MEHSKGLTWEWSGLVTGDCTGEGGGVGGKGVELVLVQRVLMLLHNNKIRAMMTFVTGDGSLFLLSPLGG